MWYVLLLSIEEEKESPEFMGSWHPVSGAARTPLLPSLQLLCFLKVFGRCPLLADLAVKLSPLSRTSLILSVDCLTACRTEKAGEKEPLRWVCVHGVRVRCEEESK